MGNVVASKAFLPPYPSYDEQMATLVWATSKLGDRIPCTYWAHARCLLLPSPKSLSSPIHGLIYQLT